MFYDFTTFEVRGMVITRPASPEMKASSMTIRTGRCMDRRGFVRGVWCALRVLLPRRSQLMLENLALRQQLAFWSNQRPQPPSKLRGIMHE